jgi:hypothetical protein
VLCREQKEGKVFFAFGSIATSIGFVHNKAVGTQMKGKKHYKLFTNIYISIRISITILRQNITLLAQKNFQSVSTYIKGNPTKTSSKLQT